MKVMKKIKYAISHKKITVSLIAAAIIAGCTSIAAAASDPVKSQGNIIFTNGTEEQADDVRFYAGDIQYLNQLVEEQISAVTEGKGKLAGTIKIKETAETVSSASTFQELSDSIAGIGKKGTVTAADVLNGKTFYNGSGYASGTMPPIGTVNVTLKAGEAYNIPQGYHEQAGKVSAASMTSQTPGTATAGNISGGKTAWVNGALLTGTMKDNGTPSTTLNAGAGYDITAGYYQGGRIMARDLASQTVGNATADNISAGKTAWVNGAMVTGNGKDNNDRYEEGKNDGSINDLDVIIGNDGVIELGKRNSHRDEDKAKLPFQINLSSYYDYQGLTTDSFVIEIIEMQFGVYHAGSQTEYYVDGAGCEIRKVYREYDPMTGILKINPNMSKTTYSDGKWPDRNCNLGSANVQYFKAKIYLVK